MHTVIKEDDNSIVYFDEKNSIFIKLKKLNQTRSIGKFVSDNDGNISYFKHEDEGQIFKILDAWSINNAVLEYLPSPDSQIVFKTATTYYTITKAQAKANGQFFKFTANAGIELKWYVRRLYFHKQSINESTT